MSSVWKLGSRAEGTSQSISVEQTGDFWNPNPVQNFPWVIRSNPNPVNLSKYLIQSGLYPKKTLIEHFTAVINAVWISISDPVEFFQNPANPDLVLKCRIRLDHDPETRSSSTLQFIERNHTSRFFTYVTQDATPIGWPRNVL